MRTEQTLILGREDLTKSSADKSILLLEMSDFNCGNEPLQTNGIVLFIDGDNGQTKIIKNRYGDKGNEAYKKLFDNISKSLDNMNNIFK